MKLRKKIALALLGAAVLSQIPFVYTRFTTATLDSRVKQLDSQRTESPNEDFIDYKGVIHIHSFLGGHSTGTFDELIVASQQSGLDFVVMTEHVSEFFDTSSRTLNGKLGSVLFVNGNETSTKNDDRFLVLDGFSDISKANKLNTRDFLSEVRERNDLAFVTYPHMFKSWNEDFDGIEVFSLHTNAKKMSPTTFLFDMIWSYGSYPELTLARYFVRPEENIRKFDELSQTKKLTLFAGSDAHSNLGLHLGDDANNKYLNLKFDPYETIFRLVRTHIVLEENKPLNKENLLEALKKGNAYIGLDILSASDGFLFSAENGIETKILGEEIFLENGKVQLRADAPQVARFVIFKDGKKILESGETTEISFEATEAGVYRTEVYLDSLGAPFDKMPWIISNPIYVR